MATTTTTPQPGDRVRILPHDDLFMRGVTRAEVRKVGRKLVTVYSWMHEREFRVRPTSLEVYESGDGLTCS